MIFSNVATHYISSNDDEHLVRYDIITVDKDKFIVKVIDNSHFRRATPEFHSELASFEITREAYALENNIGSSSVVRHRTQVTFAEHVLVKCQQHRDAMAFLHECDKL